MKISYHKDTDSLYIHLSDTSTDESEEVAEDTVLHFDEDGNVTGIEIYSDAAKRVDLSEVEVSGLEDEQAPTIGVKSDSWADAASLYEASSNTSHYGKSERRHKLPVYSNSGSEGQLFVGLRNSVAHEATRRGFAKESPRMVRRGKALNKGLV